MSRTELDILVLPPRKVPLPVRCHQLFGGVPIQIGWLLLALMTPFVWRIGLHSEILAWPRFSGPLSTAQGTITRSIDSLATEGGSEDFGIPIYDNHYTFSVNGAQYTGHSYSTGFSSKPDTPVTIEFPAANPRVSRIQGMRMYHFDAGASVMLIFPLLVAAGLWRGMRKSRTARRLLAHGVTADGVLAVKEGKVRQVGKQMFYTYSYAFSAPDGKTYLADLRVLDTEDAVPEPQLQILYDPKDPQSAMAVADLPAPVRIDDRGCVQPVSNRGALLVTILPVATLGMNAAWALARLL